MYRRIIAAFVATLAAAPLCAAQPVPQSTVLGRWANPKGTLAVNTQACGGGRLCGAITWASAEAMADARDAGVDQLIGTQLLQDYRPTGPGAWSGRVYVPDMGRTFSSRIRLTSQNTLSISGCLVAGFICKSQVWHRIQ